MNIKSLKYIIVFLIVTIFFASTFGCKKELDSPPLKTVEENMKLNIRDIYKIHTDSGDNYTFKKDYMLYATVTMDDRLGNIYKEAYVQDSTGGINLYRLSRAKSTTEGDSVRINLNGASIVYYKGKMELVFSEVVDFNKSIVIQEKNKAIKPKDATIQDILDGKFDCELIRLKDVQFTDTSSSSTFAIKGASGFTNKDLENCEGAKIIIRTSNKASFADERPPAGKGDLIGIVTKYQSGNFAPVWQIIVRKPSEIDFKEKRCEDSRNSL